MIKYKICYPLEKDVAEAYLQYRWAYHQRYQGVRKKTKELNFQSFLQAKEKMHLLLQEQFGHRYLVEHDWYIGWEGDRLSWSELYNAVHAEEGANWLIKDREFYLAVHKEAEEYA